MRALAALLFLVALGQPGAGLAAPDEALVLRSVAQEGNAPKFNLQNRQRPGICPEVMNAIRQQDRSLSFVGLERAVSLKRIENLLADDQIDTFCGLVRTPAREAQFGFIPVPLYGTRHRLAARMDDPIKVSQLEELRQLPSHDLVMVNRSSAYETLLLGIGGIPLDASIANPPLSLRKLISQRGRLYYFSERELLHYLAGDEFRGKVRLLPDVYREEMVLFAVSAKLAPDSVARLRRALERLQADGTLTRISASYRD